MELLSLVLTLKPQPALFMPGSHAAPLWWARAMHALLLDVVRQANDRLAAELHDLPGGQRADLLQPAGGGSNDVRPITVSSLTGKMAQGSLLPGETYKARLTAFHPGVAEILDQAVKSGPLAPGKTVELDYLPFQIEAGGPSPWEAQNAYSEISAPYLLGKTPAPHKLSLLFASPTTFKSGGMHMPVPLPGLVFGSLLERWNAYAPISFPPEVKRYAEECLAISQYDLSSRSVPMKSGGMRMGGVGQASYTAVNYDRYWMSVLAVLAEFSLYSGVGAGTASGLGQVRRAEF